jgi:ankyrin repeat protein
MLARPASTLKELFSAIQENKLDVIINSSLIKESSDLSVQNEEGETLISYAARLSKWDFVKWLLQYPMDKSGSYSHKLQLGSVLHYAVQQEQENYVEKLIEAGANLDEAFNPETGFRSIHDAIQLKHLPIIKLLLDHKVDLSIKTKLTKKNTNQQTPLELAVSLKEPEPKTVTLLLNAKADTTVKDSEGCTPIEQAARLNHWECVNQFLSHHHKKDPAKLGYVLWHAVGAKENNISKLLIEQNATLEKVHESETGFFSLHRAVVDGNLEIVQRLIEAKANPLATTEIIGQNKQSKTALQLAIDHEQKEIAVFLDQTAETPEKMIKYLCDSGSFMEMYNKLKELLERHPLEKILLLSKNFSDNSILSLFNLSCVVLFLKEAKEMFQLLVNIESFFEKKAHESHIYIAKAILEVIQKTFESNKKLDPAIKRNIRELFKTKIIESKRSDFSVELQHLKLIEERYCHELAKAIYSDDETSSFLKRRIFQIAASEYLQEQLQHKKNRFENIRKETLVLLFGKKIFNRERLKKNLFSAWLSEVVKLLPKENRSIFSLQPATALLSLEDKSQAKTPDSPSTYRSVLSRMDSFPASMPPIRSDFQKPADPLLQQSTMPLSDSTSSVSSISMYKTSKKDSVINKGGLNRRRCGLM